MFLWIGPLFRRIGPRVSLIRTFSKTNAPIPKKHPVFTISAGTYHEKKNTFFQTKIDTEAFTWTRNSLEARWYISDSGASMHIRERNYCDIERILFEYYGEWTNHHGRRSYCLCHRFGHVHHCPTVVQLEDSSAVLLQGKFREENACSYTWKKGHNRPYWPLSCPRSGDRVPTASGDRAQDIPDWRQTFRKDW